MRRLIAFAAATGLACASMGAPPGGPVRTQPPTILKITPESGAVNVRDASVVFEFDAIINDRGGRPFADMFMLSPHDEETQVRWRRERIEVRPKAGFLPGTAYSLTLLPGLTDLNNNAMKAGRTIVFSTGAGIPAYAIHGRVFDWVAGRVIPAARIEVLRRPDSLPYVGLSDSSGLFSIGPLDTGTYSARVIMDNNRNRLLDGAEQWDSATVTVRAASPFVELLAAQRDTIAPRLLTVAALDSMALDVSFDRLLDPTFPLTAASFRVMSADSTRHGVARVLTRAQYDANVAAAKAVRDSIVRDSIARADTSTRRDTTARRPAPTLPPPDTTGRVPGTVAPPKPSRPAPTRDAVVIIDSLTPLKPGASYRVTAVNARGLLGATRTSDRVIAVTTPVADSAVARRRP